MQAGLPAFLWNRELVQSVRLGEQNEKVDFESGSDIYGIRDRP